MQVTQVTSSNMPVMSVGNITQEQLLQEFNFIRAKEITKFMLFKGLITDEEYQLIMLENIITFQTLLSPIIWLLCWYCRVVGSSLFFENSYKGLYSVPPLICKKPMMSEGWLSMNFQDCEDGLNN